MIYVANGRYDLIKFNSNDENLSLEYKHKLDIELENEFTLFNEALKSSKENLFVSRLENYLGKEISNNA